MLATIGLLLPLLLPAETLALNLQEALTIGLKKSPLALEANAARLQSGLSFAQGINALLPLPVATITRTTDEQNTLWTGNFTINQVLFDPTVFATAIGSVINCAYHSADAREKTARLIYEITTDYLNLLKAQLLADAAQKALYQAEERKKITAERYRLGQAAKIDLIRSEAFYAQTELELLSAEKTLQNAMATFRATAGITNRTPIRATEQLTAPPTWRSHDPDSLLEMIEQTNPTVKMATELNAVAGVNLVASCTRLLPAISLYHSWTATDTALPRRYADWREKATRTAGLKISFPILDIKNVIIGIGDALAGSRRSRAALARSRLQLRTLALTAILGYEEAQRRYQGANQNLALNQELYQLALNEHRLGTISLAELLEVEANLARAEASALAALCDIYIQVAQIGYLLGKTAPATNRQ